jgi:WD40 repeat protein
MAGDFFFGGFSANSAISTRSVFIFPQPGSNSLLHPDFQPGFWVGIGESPSAAGFASIQVNNLVPGDYTLSPQGDWLAVVNGDGEGNGGQPQVRLYHQGELGDEVHLAGSLTVEDLPVLKLFDHGSDWLLLQGSSPWLKLVSLAGDQAQPFDLPDLGWPVLSAAFSPDGRWLALGGPEGQGAVWDLAKLQAGETRSGDLLPGPDHEFTTEEASPICALAFRPKQTFPFVRIRSFNWTTSGDDQLLAIAGAPGTIYTWDPDRPDPDAGVLELVSNEMEQDLPPTSATLLTQPPPANDQTDSGSGSSSWDDPCMDRPNRLAFSPDGRWLAVSTLMTNTDSTGGSFTNGKIYLADLFESDRSTFGRVALWLNDYLDDFKVEERPVWSSRQEIGRIRTLGFDSNSRWLFTGDIPVEGNPSPGGIWMWSLADLDNPAARLYMPVTAGGVSEIAFSDNGWLIARSPDSVVRLWRLDLKELVDMACTVMGRQATLNELRFYLRAENWTETSERICNR